MFDMGFKESWEEETEQAKNEKCELITKSEL